MNPTIIEIEKNYNTYNVILHWPVVLLFAIIVLLAFLLCVRIISKMMTGK